MLVIGITSRALFDLDESHKIFKNKGLEAYRDFQISNENNVLNPGQAYPLVTKLLDLNKRLKDQKSVEVVLLSRNSADTGLRIFNSIEHHGLDIKRAAFCGGYGLALNKAPANAMCDGADGPKQANLPAKMKELQGKHGGAAG